MNELRKQIEVAKRKRDKLNKKQLKIDEKNNLKKELFELKHGGKIKTVKKIGKGFKVAGGNLMYNVKRASSNFQKSRKKKKGVGGFLQRIADNQ